MSASTLANVHEWRSRIYKAALCAICTPDQPGIQKDTGVWEWNHGIPTPKESDAVILPGSAMNVKLKTSDGDILFSIWLFLGQVRIGAKIPNAIMAKDQKIGESILECYDGKTASRVSSSPTSVMFDWIFTDGFADAELMIKSMKDWDVAALIADAIANLTTHFYMSVANAVIDFAQMVISPEDLILSSKEDCVNAVITFNGNEKKAIEIIKDMGIHVDDSWLADDGKRLLTIYITRPEHAGEIKRKLSEINIKADIRFISPKASLDNESNT